MERYRFDKYTKAALENTGRTAQYSFGRVNPVIVMTASMDITVEKHKISKIATGYVRNQSIRYLY